MSKKKTTALIIASTCVLVVAAGFTILALVLTKDPASTNSETPPSSPVEQAKAAADYKEKATEKQREGNYDEAISLLKQALDIYIEQQDTVRADETAADIAAYEDIKKHMPPVVKPTITPKGE